MSAWKELRGADGSYQAVPTREDNEQLREAFSNWRTSHVLPAPTRPLADIDSPSPFFTPWLSFTLGVLVGASAVGAALAIGARYLPTLPH